MDVSFSILLLLHPPPPPPRLCQHIQCHGENGGGGVDFQPVTADFTTDSVSSLRCEEVDNGCFWFNVVEIMETTDTIDSCQLAR